MIAFLEGIVAAATPIEVILNVNGVGYRIEVPITTAEKVPPTGQKAFLYIHPVYREDNHSLYGFASAEERNFFKLVTEKVSGIGPKIGIALMSQLSLPLLRQAIANGDSALLAKCPGIGKKTAERLCVELSDKMSKAFPASSASTNSLNPSHQTTGSTFQDAVQALVALGFKLDIADKAVRKAVDKLGDLAPTETLVKTALRS